MSGAPGAATPARGAGGSGARPPIDRRLLAQAAVRRSVALSVGIGVLATAGVVAQAVGLARLVASVFPGETRADRPAALVALVAGVLVRALSALAGEVVAARGAASAKAALRAALLRGALRDAGGGGARGELATLAGRGIDALDTYVGRCLPDFVLAVAAPLALALTIGLLDWLSGLVVLVVIGLFPLFGALVGRSSAHLASERWARIQSFGSHISDLFAGLAVLRAYGRSRAQRAALERLGAELRRTTVASLRVAFLSALVLDTLASVSVALLAVPLGLRLLHGGVSLAAALAVLVLAPEVFLPLRRASAEFHESAEGVAAAERLHGLLAADDRVPAPAPSPRPGHGDDGALLCFTGVSYRHPGGRLVLEDATLAIAPGEHVVVVGENGAGKSSALALALGLRTPSAGSISWCGGPAGAPSWPEVSFLPDVPALLNASVAENLRLGAPEATDAALRAALVDAGADDLVGRMPAGLATPLGVGGFALSAGERQRIALARALLRPAVLYVLDEPTVHLDDAAEERVLAGLERRLAGRAALIVTHRPRLLGLADRVVTLRAGRFFAASPAPAARTGEVMAR